MKTKLALLLFALCTAAIAQSSSGYVFIAPGGITAGGYTAATLHFGGGADLAIWKGIGLGLELGAVSPTADFGGVVGVFSPDATYHFVRGRRPKIDPFVNAGYTLLFRTGTANLANFGGGINYWLLNRVGLKAEFRDHIYTAGTTVHYWGIRLGFTFR